jgi:serine/threonine protein kinase
MAQDFAAHQPFSGKYELLQMLDSGGFANVWLAKHIKGGNEVALKIYAHQNDEGIESFRQEYAQFAHLRHEALVNATDFDEVDGCPFLVMPYYSGGNAARLVGHFTEQDAAKLILQVGSALAYLHEHNVVHQDIKPNNFLLDKNGNFLLSDLGLSLKTRATFLQPTDSPNNQKGATPPCYRAPELFGNKTKIVQPIKATDTWAFGASLFELITGDVPFGELGGVEQKADPSVPQMSVAVSPELQKIVSWCLDAETWERPTSLKLFEWARHFKETGRWFPQGDRFVTKKTNPNAYKQSQTHSSGVTQYPSVYWRKWAAVAAVLLLGWFGWSRITPSSKVPTVPYSGASSSIKPTEIPEKIPPSSPNSDVSVNTFSNPTTITPSRPTLSNAEKDKQAADRKQQETIAKLEQDKANLERDKQAAEAFAAQQQREIAQKHEQDRLKLEKEKQEMADKLKNMTVKAVMDHTYTFNNGEITVINKPVKAIKLIKIRKTTTATVVTMMLEGSSSGKVSLYGPNQRDQAFRIVDKQGRKYYLTRVSGISVGEKITFSGNTEFDLYFPPLQNSIKSFDILEGEVFTEKDMTYWHFTGVELID